MYTGISTVVFSHIVLNDGQWSVGFVLDSNDLTSTDDYQQRVLKRLTKVRREWIEQIQGNSLKEKVPSYNNDLLVAQQNMKSLQERLLELESQQGRINSMCELMKGWMDSLTEGYNGIKEWINE